MNDEKYAQGMDVRTRVLGEEYVSKSLSSATAFTKPMQDLVTENCWGQQWATGVIPDKTRSLITIAILASLRASTEIKTHVYGALRNGCTVDEIQDVLLHAAVYCGMPAGIDAFRAAKEVVEQWEAKGED